MPQILELGATAGHFGFDLPTAAPTSAVTCQTSAERRKQQMIRGASVFFNVLCGVTNGYDICVTSVVLDAIVEDLGLCNGTTTFPACAQKQAVMSLTALGSLLGKLCLSWTADRFGRRAALAFIDLLLLASVLLQCWARTAVVFFAGRVILGMGTGLAFVVGPTYICEIAPPDRRGQLVVLNEVAVTVGCIMGLQVGAVAISLGGYSHWRIALAAVSLPAMLQLLFVCALPESPRWLALMGDTVGLEIATRKLGMAQEEADPLHEIAALAMQEKTAMGQGGCLPRGRRVSALLSSQREPCGTHGLAFLVALGIAVFATASGNFGLQAYAYDVLRLGGVRRARELLPLIGWMKLVGALVATVGADGAWLGRRRLVILGSGACSVCMLVLAARLAAPGLVAPGVSAAALFLFFLFWNAGIGGLQFVSILEMLPTAVRSVWSGVIFAFSGIVEILIFQLFENFINAFGQVAFASFALINFCGLSFAAFMLPDLRGRSLEEGPSEPVGLNASGTNETSSGHSAAQTTRCSPGALAENCWGAMRVHRSRAQKRYGVLKEDAGPGGGGNASAGSEDCKARMAKNACASGAGAACVSPMVIGAGDSEEGI